MRFYSKVIEIKSKLFLKIVVQITSKSSYKVKMLIL